MRRLRFDVSDEAMRELEALRAETGLTSTAALLCESLRLYAWLIRREDSGWQVVIRREEEERLVKFARKRLTRRRAACD